MSKLEPVIRDVIFREKLVLEDDLIEKVHATTNVEKEKIKTRIGKLLEKGKAYRFQEKGIALQDFGDDLEKKARDQLEKIFFEEYVFSNPILESGKELCDLLIYFDNKLILIQAKTATFKGNYDRFVKKVVSKSISQLKASINRCVSEQVEIVLTDTKGRSITIDKKNLSSVLGIVLVYQIEPIISYDKARMTCGEMLEDMDQIPHIFALEEVENLLEILDTPWDFIDYLGKREEIVSNPAYTMVSEADMLSFYYTTNRTMIPAQGADSFQSADMILLDGFEEDLTTGELANLLKKRKHLDKPSFVVDNLIERAKECPGNYEAIIQRLHGMNRVQRRAIGIAGIDKYSQMMGSGKDFGFRLCYGDNQEKLGIILVFSTLPEEETRDRMRVLAAVAKYNKELCEVIAISHRPYDQQIQQNDFLLDLTEYSRPNQELEDAFSMLWGQEEHVHIEEFNEKPKTVADSS